MTGLEQLKLAAKAGGVEVTERDGVLFVRQSMVHEREWNSRADDGDALRLAVRLRFGIKDFAPHDDEPDATPSVGMIGMIEIWRESDDDPLYVEWYKAGFDRYAATRRAITHAAALIGKGIP
jgi:hypothetical protein